MARGRMISNKVCLDRSVSDLSDDTSRLAFTWLVTFADVEGRTYGDPAAVRSLVFPRRTDVTVDQMAGYLQEWHESGLIVWYVAGGDWWVWFPGFEKNQKGLRKDRESPSEIPEPTAIVPVYSDASPQDGAELLRSGAPDSPRNVSEEKINSNIREGRTNSAEPGADAPALTSSERVDPAPEPKKQKRRSRADPRTKHPAIQAVRAVLGGTRYPSKGAYDGLIEAIGDVPDVDLLRRCHREWSERGYNPNSYKWAIDWYSQGGPPGHQGARGRASNQGLVSDNVRDQIKAFANGGG